jgi:hypothetical protein
MFAPRDLHSRRIFGASKLLLALSSPRLWRRSSQRARIVKGRGVYFYYSPIHSCLFVAVTRLGDLFAYCWHTDTCSVHPSLTSLREGVSQFSPLLLLMWGVLTLQLIFHLSFSPFTHNRLTFSSNSPWNPSVSCRDKVHVFIRIC